MGVGMDGKLNYSEDDVKECARAFTGWTVSQRPSRAIPMAVYLSTLHLRPERP